MPLGAIEKIENMLYNINRQILSLLYQQKMIGKSLVKLL